jgi:hypothetical protein
MRYIIFKDINGYCVTSEANYTAVIQDARQIQKLYDFTSTKEIINYFCKYGNYKKSDFIEV